MSEINDATTKSQGFDLLFQNIKYFVTGNVDQNVLDLLRNGGAERMNYFSDYVTHLICGDDPEDTDISDAVEIYEIPAVMPKWISMCASLQKLVSLKPYLFNNKKLFTGLTFCFSQITTDRNALWAIITYNGGIVQLNLDINCSHLVTTTTTSAKYFKAFSLGTNYIEIVTPDWILESVRNDALVSIEAFHPKLIIVPKVVKHESTTAITGFEPETTEEIQPSTEDSTQALLEKLKQRMPWNQPPATTTIAVITTKEIVPPPNVVAPSYTNRLPITSKVQQNLLQAQQERVLAQAQQLMQTTQISQQPQAQSPQHVNQQIPISQMQPTQQLLHSPVQSQQPMLQSPVQRQPPLLQSQVSGQQLPQSQGQHLLQAQIQQSQALLQTQMQRQLSQSANQEQLLQSPMQEQQLHRQASVPEQLMQSDIQLQNQQLSQSQLQQLPQQFQQVQVQLSQSQPQVVQTQLQQAQVQQNLMQQLTQQQQQQVLQQTPQVQVQQQNIMQRTLVHQPVSQEGLIGQPQPLYTQQQPNQIQLVQNRLQLQQQQRALLSQLAQQQGNKTQFTSAAQQIIQRNQINLGQVVQPQLTQIIQRAQIGQIGKTSVPVNIQQLQQQLVGRQQLAQSLQQQQFGNVVQSQQPTLINQGSAFTSVGQQQAQILNQNHLQQQQQQQQQQIKFAQNQEFAHQFNQNQQFVQTPHSQAFSPIQQQQQVQQQQQIVQNQFVQNRAQTQFGVQALLNPPMSNVQSQPPQQQIVNQPQQLVNQPPQLINQQKPILLTQSVVQQQTLPSKPGLWQPQQQQVGIRQPTAIVQQPQQQQQLVQGSRLQWPPNQQPAIVQQRQYIHLDAQTHHQLQQMGPEQRSAFIAKLQHKQRLLLQQRQQLQLQQQSQQQSQQPQPQPQQPPQQQIQQQQQQLQQQRVLIRSGSVPQGLTPQQQMQWLQQQSKQGIVLQQNSPQHTTPGLSPIQQNATPQINEMQRQQQLRLQQLQIQREQVQTPAPIAAPQPNISRPIGQPQIADVVVATTPVTTPTTTIVDANLAQQQLVVNAKTKTALANMLSIRLQSGATGLGPVVDTLPEPSAAGTLRLMTAQHNAALNTNNRTQELLGITQRRLSSINSEVMRPTPAPSVPPPPPQTPSVQPPTEPVKMQFSPRTTTIPLPLQHRQGPFYGHNPNLKLPPDLFLLGCIFVVVEVDRFLEESRPNWQKQIEKHGGEVEKQYCSRVTHVLCETQRHGVVMQALRDCKRCVTLFWLSDVLKRKQVLPPWTALHLPTMYLDTTPASKHLISLTGFVNSERSRIKTMIKYIGATFTSYFSKHNTLLVTGKSEGPKFNHAKKWGTPVVNVQWLTDVLLGNFTAFNQTEHIKYQQFTVPPVFNFDPALVPSLMHAWKMPINISQESYERVKRSASPVLLPKKHKKIKTEDKMEDEEFTPVSSTHRILFSLFPNDISDLKKIVRDLGGSFAQSHQDCTHLIMPYLGRSNKLLHCICLGVHILPESWLRDSHVATKFLDPSNYALDTKDFNSEYKCDFNQTLATRNRNKLLEGKFFYITPSVFPSKNMLSELIRSCGGIVEKHRRTVSQIEATNINSPYSYIILTHANDLHLVYDVLKNKKEKIRTVCNVELIYSAILKQTFEVEPYAVQVSEERH